MNSVPLLELKNSLTEVVTAVEAGETVVVTRDGRPILDLVPHQVRTGLNWAALAAFKKEHGIERFVEYIPEDFDDPLPEDFLIKPLPPTP